MTKVALLIDWENVFYSLRNDYNKEVPPYYCLTVIRRAAEDYGEIAIASLFYTEHLQTHQLIESMRSCAITGFLIHSSAPKGKPDKNLADTYLVAEAVKSFFVEQPDTIIIVSGDKGYIPVITTVRTR